MFAIAVANTETDELSLMGPYAIEAIANAVRDSFVAEMDARYGILDVYSVWVVPMRSLNTETTMFQSLFDLYRRTEREARTLESTELEA